MTTPLLSVYAKLASSAFDRTIVGLALRLMPPSNEVRISIVTDPYGFDFEPFSSCMYAVGSRRTERHELYEDARRRRGRPRLRFRRVSPGRRRVEQGRNSEDFLGTSQSLSQIMF